MGAGQIGVSHDNDENGSRTIGKQHPLPPTRLRFTKAPRTQGPRSREDIRSFENCKRARAIT